MLKVEEAQPGLTFQEARARLKTEGPNQIYKPYSVTFVDIFLEEIKEPMILLLLVTGVLYSILGNLGDALTIFVVIILLVFAEVFTEYRAKSSIAALEAVAAVKARVQRDGEVVDIDALDVVPGDLLVLTEGTKVPADARVEHGVDLTVDESALTGESAPVDKTRGDQLYAGTIVVSGEAEAQVTATGPQTRLGKVASQTQAIKPPKTALQRAMRSLSGTLAIVAIFLSVAIPFLGFLRGQDWRLMVLTGLALGFAVIPEELPIVITMVLGVGSYSLSKRNFLVKRLQAAERMGDTTVIVTDKTGTITEGQMKLVAVWPEDKAAVLRTAALCLPEFALTPLDREILQQARENGMSEALPAMVRERGLGAGRKSRAVIRQGAAGYTLYKSGAPEEVFASSRAVPAEAQAELDQQSRNGRRVIAVARKDLAASDVEADWDAIEQNMDLAGLISFEDPPRAGVRETIAQTARAGIRTMMVTGDHPATAAYIAQQVGITGSKVVTGDALDRLTDQQLQTEIENIAVVARSTPEQKYRIVKALQANHEVVAVTGDGINDVLALKGADVGIAMGKKGTDVARETAGVVLADDNFNTIAQGIFEGRALFDNLKKGTKYYLSIKLALVLIFLIPVLIGVPLPFAPIQIIILELFMDLAASAGFVAEPKEKNLYVRRPRDPQQPIFDRAAIGDVVVKALLLFAVVTGIYLYALAHTENVVQAQTYAFASWIVGHVMLAYVSRSDDETILAIGPFANRVMNLWALAAVTFLFLAVYVPRLNALVRLAAVPLPYLLLAMAVSAAVILLLEFRKRGPVNVSRTAPAVS
jgi:Ca2+-transporting ATPase